MVKIMIADDQQLIRESLKIILDSDPSFEVVKVVGSGQEVLDSLKTWCKRLSFKGLFLRRIEFSYS